MMLALRAGVADIDALTRDGYLFDLKIDGVRCRAEVNDGGVRLFSRSGADMTLRYPEVVAALKDACPSGSVVLDGELAVNDERGLPSWPLTHKRDAQQSRVARWAETLPATYYVFDMLQLNSLNLRPMAYANRRQILESELHTWQTPAVQPVLHSISGATLWKVVEEFHLEGMVAKRAGARYRSGRSRDWLKIKNKSTVTCLVGGYDVGEGARAKTFGALHLYLLDESQKPTQVGKVGSGFSDRELVLVKEALPHPPVIVEVEYLDVSPDGQLRQPVFKCLRHDVDLMACTTDQLAYKEAT